MLKLFLILSANYGNYTNELLDIFQIQTIII